MELMRDQTATLAQALADKLDECENGSAIITLSDGTDYTVYEPVYVGKDYIEFMLGEGIAHKLVVIPIQNVLRIVL